MNAPLSKEQLARLAVANLAYHGEYVEGLTAPFEAPRREGVVSLWLRGLSARIRAHRGRRTVLNELAQLSDRDLADIGLSRGQLQRVFDPEFARNRDVNA
jgi:uncharacterized protein YjiS (DUF1127 family)